MRTRVGQATRERGLGDRVALLVAGAGLALSALSVLPTSVAWAADEVPASLNQPFIGTTPSLAWQYRLPDAQAMGEFFSAPGSRATAASFSSLPEYRTKEIIGGGAFADAPGFQSKVNAFWFDPSVPDFQVTSAVNIAAFDTVAQATAAVLADAEAMGATLIDLAPERGWQRWHGVVNKSPELDRISWIVDPSPSPTVIRVLCVLYGPKSLHSRCQMDSVDRMAQTIGMTKSVPTTLDASVVAALPISPAGLTPVLAVSVPGPVVWNGLQPTRALTRAVRSATSTVIQYAPATAGPLGVHLSITPLAKAADAREFITQICGGTPPGERCTTAAVSRTSSGQLVVGEIATLRRNGRVTSVTVQATGNGKLVMVSCSDLRDYGVLTTVTAQTCTSAVSSLLDEAIK